MNRNEFKLVASLPETMTYPTPITVPIMSPNTINAANKKILSNLLVLLMIGKFMM